MFTTAERIFRSGELIFRSGEYTFRIAEHTTKTYSYYIIPVIVNEYE